MYLLLTLHSQSFSEMRVTNKNMITGFKDEHFMSFSKYIYFKVHIYLQADKWIPQQIQT